MKQRLMGIISNIHTSADDTRTFEDVIATELIAHDVIALPCKVGDAVYFADHENKTVWGGKVVSFCLDAAHFWFNCHYKCGLNMWHPIEDFGKTVFLTREEAEKALAERGENGT